MTKQKLSILMPVYNERTTIESIIAQVMNAPLPDAVERELIVVDDCSNDGTSKVLHAVQSKYPTHIQVITHPRNHGKGASIATAIKASRGDICIVQDADLEYDPREYAKVLQPILNGDADVVYGSRFLSSDYRRVLYFWHSMGNHLLTFLSNMFTDLNLTDMETCYKAVRSSILKSIPIRCRRFGIEVELTAKFAKRRCRIYEIPITYRGRTYAEGKKITWRDGFKAILAIIYFWLVDDIYEERYGHAILHRLEQAHRFNRWMYDKIKRYIGDQVLEIGAGIGNLTRLIIPRKLYWATDIDPFYLETLENLYGNISGMQVVPLDLEDPDGFNTKIQGRPDTVICLNVLEHVKNDGQGLKNIFDVMDRGGRVVLLVPAGKWLLGSLDKVLGHQRRYAKAEIAQKCQGAGFVIERIFAFDRIGVFGWALNGLILHRKKFGKIQLKIFDSFIYLWKLVDLIPFIPGLSWIAIARKP